MLVSRVKLEVGLGWCQGAGVSVTLGSRLGLGLGLGLGYFRGHPLGSTSILSGIFGLAPAWAYRAFLGRVSNVFTQCGLASVAAPQLCRGSLVWLQLGHIGRF